MTERSQGVQDLIPKIPRDERWIKGCKTYVNSPKICCLSNEVDIFLLLSGSIYHNRIFGPLLYWGKKYHISVKLGIIFENVFFFLKLKKFVPKAKSFWPFTVRMNCSSDLKHFANSGPSTDEFFFDHWNFFFS